MRTYLVEVHGTLLQTLVNLMNDYSTNLLLYKDGYYQIDSHLHTKLPGQEFTRLHSDLKGSRDKLKNEIELLNTTKDKISDLVSYDGSSHTSTVMDYNFLLNQIKNLDSSITQYESNQASQDLVAFKESSCDQGLDNRTCREDTYGRDLSVRRLRQAQVCSTLRDSLQTGDPADGESS